MFQGTMLQYFHWYISTDGNLWKQIKTEAGRLKELRFYTIWLPPAFKGTSGGFSTGYDIYDLYDMGEFDQKGSVRTKYGTKEEYIEAINAIHDAGMRVMVDIVLNHKAGGDEKEKISVIKMDPENRNKIISEPFEIEAYTKFTFPGRGKKYSDFKWNSTCFTAVDYAADLNESGVFAIQNRYEKLFEDMIANEKGNYDFLMYNDIDFRNETVRDELLKWGKWYWDQAPFDAMRLDAVKHISPGFYQEWLINIRKITGNDFFAVGEYWATGHLNLLLEYIDATKDTMSLSDSSLHQNFSNASKLGDKIPAMPLNYSS